LSLLCSSIGCGVDKNDLWKKTFFCVFISKKTLPPKQKNVFLLRMTSSRRWVTRPWAPRTSWGSPKPSLRTLQTCWAAAGPPERMKAPSQTVCVSSASPTTDPTPTGGVVSRTLARKVWGDGETLTSEPDRITLLADAGVVLSPGRTCFTMRETSEAVGLVKRRNAALRRWSPEVGIAV
jgi:hypothetical protein